MDYREKIAHSQKSAENMSVSQIWDETSKVEQVGIKSCIEHYTFLGYKTTTPKARYHPQWDLKFTMKDDVINELLISLPLSNRNHVQFLLQHLVK